MKIASWFIFVILFCYLFGQNCILAQSNYSLVSLSFADAALGNQIINTWSLTHYGDQTYLALAQKNTQWDFVFIVVYVCIIIMVSNAQMQKEKSSFLNEMLRLNFFIALFIGGSDFIENLLFMHNFHHVGDIESYQGTFVFSFIKWGLLSIVITILIISMLKKLVSKT